MESEKNNKTKQKQIIKTIDVKNRLVVARGRDLWVGEMIEKGQNKYGEVMYSTVIIVSNTALHIWKLLKE